MDCKGAATDGDAIRPWWLRQKGIASAENPDVLLLKVPMATTSTPVHGSAFWLVNCRPISRSWNMFQALLRDVSMQVAACPASIRHPGEILTESVSEKGLEMGRDDLDGKPEQMKVKIVEGRIGKRLKELAAMEQPFIKDSSITVADLVKQTAGKIVRTSRCAASPVTPWVRASRWKRTTSPLKWRPCRTRLIPLSDPDVRPATTSEQLARLQRLCRLRAIALYREQALYLQVLRELLSGATRQALFNLLGEVDPSRFSRLPESTRQNFHASVDDLISRCSVLLTVEQLMPLVQQMQQEQRRQQAHAGRTMLQNLSRQTLNKDPEPELSTSPPQPEEPSGSIQLSLASPLDSPPAATASGPGAEPGPEHPDAKPTGDLDVLRSLFELAGDAMQQAQQPVEANGALDQSIAGDDHFLPNEPDALLHWIYAMDQALERRLRNLSHAVNVQMLRSGLAQTLLPISLLDAVLKGQVETQPTATNVLRLRLPLAVGDLDQGMDVFVCSCAARSARQSTLASVPQGLRTHHHALLTMVRQQRHWQRRSLDREAEPIGRPIRFNAAAERGLTSDQLSLFLAWMLPIRVRWDWRRTRFSKFAGSPTAFS